MNVASKELCKELYELSGWNDPEQILWSRAGGHPEYTLGYLLRKLMPYEPFVGLTLTDGWVAYTKNWNVNPSGVYIERENTPEDAAAKLAIELFKQGLLNNEEQEKQ
jgi:hypothetical protein